MLLAVTVDAQPIYPDLTGDDLTIALASTYTPSATYSYDRARDTLFAAIHLERAADASSADSLRGFYSGHAIALDPALDPTAAAWASSPRYSTEHLWPQSQGTTEGTPAHADMHHLAPVMQSINSSRSDHPFGEIMDAGADRWWGPDGVTRTAMPPVTRRDLYTEKRNGASPLLEPRESVEGDVARAMFYVWTVYGPSGADQLDVEFWTAQRATLLDWHQQDPSDEDEITRTLTIATHQGTANPFVLDATLAERAFGPPPVQVALASFTVQPTADGQARVQWSTTVEAGITQFRVDGRADVFGATWTPWAVTDAQRTPSSYTMHVPSLAPGTYRVGLTALHADGAYTALGDIGLAVQASTPDEDAPTVRPVTLTALAPNPTDGHTTATLVLDHTVHVRAVVYDALGREAIVVLDRLAVGLLDLRVDTTALAPGLYLLRVVASDGSATASQSFSVAR